MTNRHITKEIFRDPVLERTSPADLSVIFYIGLNNLRVAFRQKSENKFISLARYHSDRIEGLPESETLSLLFRELTSDIPVIKSAEDKKAILETGFYTLVPAGLFNKNSGSTYLNFNYKIPAGLHVLTNTIQNNEIINVFGVDKKYLDLINRLAGFPEILHQCTVFSESHLVRYQRKNEEGRVFLSIRYQYLDILYLKNDTVQYLNSFECRSNEDFAYFVLFALEQLGLNPETIEAGLSGEVDENETVFNILSKFIRNIEIISPYNGFSYSEQIDPLELQRNYLLFNAGLCG